MEKQNLFGKTLNELTSLVREARMPVYSAKQIADWLYKKHVSSIDEMLNISKANREKLIRSYRISHFLPSNVQISSDGTKKYLFPAASHKFIEAAYIPEKERKTLCLSSQVGCKMGCLFCMTGKQGFQAHLTAGEIVNQVRSLPEREELTNIVYMGMGEPFDNLDNVLKSLEILTSDWGYAMSPRRITVSSIGIIPAMRTFIEKSQCHLAISLHTPFDEEREKIMPIETIYPLKEVIRELKKIDWKGQRRISFEYIMFKDFNDTEKHVKELTKLLNGLKCRLNLIRFHAIPDSPLTGSSMDKIEGFKNRLNEKGVLTTIRKSRGEDIYAACGLLSTKTLVKQEAEDF